MEGGGPWVGPTDSVGGKHAYHRISEIYIANVPRISDWMDG